MRGQHEPPDGRSFYLSLGTSAVRFAIVVVLAAAGAFTIARAFPQTEKRLSEGGATTSAPTPPADKKTEEPQQPESSPQVKGVKVAVFNTTDVTGLAGLTGDKLAKKGYTVPEEYVLQASSGPFSVTRVFYRSEKSKPDADYIAATFFKGAKVEELGAGTAEVPDGADVVVYLGDDYASKHEK